MPRKNWLRSVTTPFLVGLACAAVATGVTIAIPVVVRVVPAAFFYAAVAVAGAMVGWIGGLSAALASAAVLPFIVQPREDLTGAATTAVVIATFVVVAATMVWLRSASERKQSELQRSKNQIETILAGVTDGVTVLDKSGRLLYANYAAARVLGYPSTEALLKTEPASVAPRFEIWNEAGNPMDGADLPGRRAVRGELDAECTVRYRSGAESEHRWAVLRAVPFFGATGEVVFAVSTFHDITAQKTAEQAQRFLAEASKTLSSSLDYETTLTTIVNLAIPHYADGCSMDILEDDEKVTNVHLAFADPAKTELMRRIRSAHPYDPNRPNPLINALRTGRPVVFPDVSQERRTVATSAEHYRLSLELGVRSAVLVPLRIDDRKLALLTFMLTTAARKYGESDLRLMEELASRAGLAIENARLYSVSEQQRREAERITRLKDEFLATLSHELRTPLNAILGWSRMLRKRQLNADTTHKALETIERNAGIQAQLIDDLLDMSRIISGKFRMDFGIVDMTGVVQEVMDSVRLAAEAKEIRINTVLHGDPCTVSGDRTRLQQIAWNLLSNAVKFTPHGGNIDISLNLVGSTVRLTVTDSGIGIDPEFLPFVFDRFRQADGSTARGYAGLGLGLAIVRHIVELHGGAVRAESVGRGKGASFTVEIPLRQVELPVEAAAGAGNVSIPHANLAGIRVLVIDDEADARFLLEQLLSTHGAVVRTAASVEEALAKLDTFKADAVVSDIGMPLQDGFTLIHRIRSERNLSAAELPAIALTAYADVATRLKVLSAGFQMHLVKPIDPVELTAVVASVVGRLDRPRSASQMTG